MSIEKTRLTDHSKRNMRQREGLKTHFQVHVMLVHFSSEESIEKPNNFVGNSKIIGVILFGL